MRKANGDPGNTKSDREWLAEHEAELVKIPDGEFAGLLQWDGTKESKGSPWQIPRDENRCTAFSYLRDEEGQYVMDADNRRLRRPCFRWRIPGATVCFTHGGGTPEAQRKAKERLLASADTVVGALIQLATSKKVMPKDRIAAINSILDRGGIKGTDKIEVLMPEYEKLLDKWTSGDTSEVSEDE